MGELKLIKSLVFLCLHFQLNAILCHIPNSPCPNIFEYVPNGGEYYGKLNLDTKWHSEEIKIKINLSITSLVEFGPEDSRGNIELLNGRDNALADIKAGKPIQYRVNFPKSCVPAIEEIIVNDENICRGTINKKPPNTRILLQHITRYFNVRPKTHSALHTSSRKLHEAEVDGKKPLQLHSKLQKPTAT